MELNLPSFNFTIKEENGKLYILDNIRKRFVKLTPEEEVRQRFVAMLISAKGYPAGRIGNEISLSLNGTKRRCDTLIFDNLGNPCAIIEYKAPDIIITQEVFNQITRYNYVFKVKYIIVSNGLQHFCCKIDYLNNSYTFLKDIPEYSTIINN